MKLSQTNCLLCGGFFRRNITLAWLFTLKKSHEGCRQWLCDGCFFKKLNWLNNQPTCCGCGRQIIHSGTDKNYLMRLCRDCRIWEKQQRRLINNQALLRYNDAMKSYLQRFKFWGDIRLAAVFARELEQLILRRRRQQKQPAEWLIVPIPVSKTTANTRGFNQVTALLAQTRLRFCDALVRQDDFKQVAKTRSARIKQPPRFICDEATVAQKAIILVDDVYTTGATLYQAKQTLIKAKARKVISVTLCR